MSLITAPLTSVPIEYPDSDGEPIAENTKQYRYIVTIKGGLDIVFKDNPNVFVAGDLLWYPVEGSNTIATAPDVMVVFNRPKGDRRSYMQWREDDIPPQVVFEILSPTNRAGKLAEKFEFYEKYGVEEYYVYDPDDGTLEGWQRIKGKLTEIADMKDWISPRLKIRFELEEGELNLYGPNGRKFLTQVELEEKWEQAQTRAERLAAKLRELGIDPDQ